MKSLIYFLNESKRDFFKELQDEKEWLDSTHSRGAYHDDWYNLILRLYNGEEDLVARSKFRKSRGDQYGLDWVDSLVDKGLLVSSKIGRTVMLGAPDNMTIKKDISDKAFNQLYKKFNKKMVRYDAMEQFAKMDIDSTKEVVTITSEVLIPTKIHWEKGHFGDISKGEQDEDLQNKIDSLKNSKEVIEIAKQIEDAKGSVTITDSIVKEKNEGKYVKGEHPTKTVTFEIVIK